MTSSLENRYRKLLRWYPRAWRARHEDAFLGTALEMAEAENCSVPSAAERAAIIAHGAAARIDLLIVPGVRDAGSTIALTMGAGISFAVFVMSSWAPWLPGNPALGWLVQVGPFYDTGFAFAGLWLIAVIAALAGKWIIGRAALVISIFAGVVTPHVFQQLPGVYSLDRATLALLSSCALIAVLGRPRRGLAMSGATLGWALLAVYVYVTPSFSSEQWESSRTLWGHSDIIWYGAILALVVAFGFAVARFWPTTFTIILGLTPLAIALAANQLRGIAVESGTAAVIAVPVGVGLLLLILHSSGRLRLPATRRRRRATFESTLAVLVLVGGLIGSTGINQGNNEVASASGPASNPAAPTAFSGLTPDADQPTPEPVTPSNFDELVSSGHLTAVQLGPTTGRVLSASGQDLTATETNQKALTRVAFASNTPDLIRAYVSTHATAVTESPETGRISSVTFSSE